MPITRDDQSCQSWLIHRMQSLGYNSNLDQGGVCYGYAHRIMQGMFEGDHEKLFQFFDNLYSSKDFYNAKQFETRIKENNAKINNFRLLMKDKSKEEKEVISLKISAIEVDIRKDVNILANMETILLYHDISKYNFLLEPENIQGRQNALGALPLVDSETIEKEGGLQRVENFSGVYTKDELVTYFKSFRDVFDTEPKATYPIPLVLEGYNHAITVAYDPQKEEWMLYDANQRPTKVSNEKDVAEFVTRSLFYSESQPVAFATYVFATSSKAPALETKITQLQENKDWIEIHNPTEDKLKYSEPKPNIWLYLAMRKNQSILNPLLDTLKKMQTLPNLNDPSPILYLASVFKNDVQVVEKLIRLGAEINTVNESDSNALKKAVMNGNEEMVKLLIKEGANVNHVDGSKLSILHSAVRVNNPSILKMLIDAGTNINALDKFNNTPLHHAVYFNQPNTAKVLIDCGANVYATNSKKQSPLYLAGLENRKSIISEILKKNKFESLVNIGILTSSLFNRLLRKKDKLSCPKSELYFAARSGHIDTLLRILESGTKTDYFHTDGLTPLMIAAKCGHSEIVELLLSRAADLNSIDSKGMKAVDFAIANGHVDVLNVFIKYNIDLTTVDSELNTFLHKAVQYKQVEVVKEILKQGVNSNSINEEGFTPLMIAAKSGNPEIVELLLSRAPDLSIINNKGENAIDFAIVNGHVEVLNVFIKYNIDLAAVDAESNNYLHKAVQYNQIEVVKEILKQGIIDLNSVNKEGSTPLIVAAEANNFGMIKCLVNQHGVDVDINICNTEGKSALNYAIENYNQAAAFFLIEAGANLNLPNAQKEKLLCFAVEEGNLKIVQDLLKLKVNPNLITYENNTLLCRAIKANNLEIVKVLLACNPPPNLNHVNGNRDSPLTLAITANSAVLVEVLLKNGANPNQSQGSTKTPLVMAVNKENPSIVGSLLDYGANLEVSQESLKELMQRSGVQKSNPIYGLLMSKMIKSKESLEQHFGSNQPVNDILSKEAMKGNTEEPKKFSRH